MRSAAAALALAGVVMAGEGYNTKAQDPYTPYDPSYSTAVYDPEYPPTYPSSYDPSYPSTYDPSYPYPTGTDYPYDPSYPYPTSTKKDDAYDPYSTCTDDSIYTSTKKNADYYPTDYPVYPYTSTKKDADYPYTSTCTDDILSYTTSTVYQTKYYVVTKDKDVHTKTDEYAVTTTVYPVYKTKVAEKEYEKEKYPEKPSYPASKYPEKETKKYEAAAACPTYSVKTIHTSVTTVVPTVIYETVAVPCSTYKPTPYTNATATKPTTKYPVVTAGASSFAASGLVAAVVGLAAVAFL